MKGWRWAWIALAVCWADQVVLAQNKVRIGLNEGALPVELQVAAVAGGFEWTDAEGKVIEPLGRSATVAVVEGRLVVSGKDLDYAYLRPILPESRVQLRVPGEFPTVHAGSMHLLLEQGRIRCVLETELETYLQGVLSAESGKGHHPEYYRAQAVVSRTYTLQALERHRMQGFNLCDDVHCQAYHGIGSVNDTLREAVISTRGMVLIDQKGKPITAAFHSNCGGQTQGAENVWQRPLGYLIGVPDTFCLAMPHAQWTKSVDSESWRSWLNEHREGTSERTTFLPNARMDCLPDSGARIRAVEARESFGLQSSYFVVVDDGQSVRFMGQGFGHGVGLCQEGAMQRARSGATFDDILHHYYTGVRLTSIQALGLFREE
jgi:stage II sporulation protein D